MTETIIITLEDIQTTWHQTKLATRDNNFAASASACLYQHTVNVGTYIRQQGDNISKEDREGLCEAVLSFAKTIKTYTNDVEYLRIKSKDPESEPYGVMDEADLHMWKEALDHMRLSFEERCPHLLPEVLALMGQQDLQQTIVPKVVGMEPR